MEEAFSGINQAVTYSDSFLNREIKQIDIAIDDTKNELVETQNKIKLGCKAQLNKIKFKDGNFLPIDVIQRLKTEEEEEKHSWLQDDVKYTTNDDIDGITTVKAFIPIEENELSRLTTLKYKLNNNLQDLYQDIVPTNSIIPPIEFEKLVKDLIKIQQLNTKISSYILLRFIVAIFGCINFFKLIVKILIYLLTIIIA